MYRSSTSAAGVRFLSSIKEGRGLKRSAREAGVDKEVGYRWLRECYLRHRRDGVPAAEVEALLSFSSVRVAAWEAGVGNNERHHLRVDVSVETVFWGAYESGLDVAAAAGFAGVSRSTFDELRATGVGRRKVQRLLRLTDRTTAQAEQRRRDRLLAERRAALTARREALRSSRRFADQAAGLVPSKAQRRRVARDDAYWQSRLRGVQARGRPLGRRSDLGSGLRLGHGEAAGTHYAVRHHREPATRSHRR